MANTEQALKDALRRLLEQTQGAEDCVMDPTAYKEAQQVAKAALTAASAEAATPVAWIPLDSVAYSATRKKVAWNWPIFTSDNSTDEDRRRYHENSYDLTPVFAAPQASQPIGQTAEDYLRGKYGAYRGHYEWRALEEAFNAGKASNSQPVSGAMTDEQLADMWDESTGNMTVATIRAIRNFARALISASGQAGQTEAPVNVPSVDAVIKQSKAVLRLVDEYIDGVQTQHTRTKLRSGLMDLFAAAPAPVAQTEAQQSSEKDAERYRWLRNPDQDVSLVLDKRKDWVPPDDAVPEVGGYWTYEYRCGEELDAAIDAAIAKEQAK